MARYIPLPAVGRPNPRNLRLSDLYLRTGQAQADAELRSGLIKAKLFGDIGQAIGQTASSIIQAPQIAKAQAAEEVERAQAAKLRGMQIGEAERAVNERENFDLAMTEGGGSRKRTLELLKDRPELYEKAQGHFQRIDTSMKQLLGDAAAGIADFGYTPEAAMAAMDDLLDQGFDERKIEPFRAAIAKDPSAVKQIVDSLLSQSPDPKHQAMARPKPLVELNKDTSLYDPNKGEVVAEGPKSPEPREPNPTEASLAAAAANGDKAAAEALRLLRAQNPPAVREPERPSVWLKKGSESRFVTPTQAAQMVQEGWQRATGDQKPASGLEKRALNFFNRAQQADKDLEGLEDAVRAMGLGGQTRMAMAPNFLQSEVGQRYTQAQRAFTEARLRKDSGAAIPKEEFENDRKTYFVQPGDSQETQEQKRRARAAILSSLGFESGQALGEFVGDAEEASRIVQDYRARSEKKSDATKDGETVKVGGFTVRVKP